MRRFFLFFTVLLSASNISPLFSAETPEQKKAALDEKVRNRKGNLAERETLKRASAPSRPSRTEEQEQQQGHLLTASAEAHEKILREKVEQFQQLTLEKFASETTVPTSPEQVSALAALEMAIKEPVRARSNSELSNKDLTARERLREVHQAMQAASVQAVATCLVVEIPL